ncbi:tripartite tricarboxylate transporter substrate binding protein [Rhizobium sp. P32RR-XVIII]|uniref:Bug family tripartite tricarboxylate transporter substrate binding protein n=1 Tax=Rhizobium sp. P32RR-XVIII TaxID=2726738 RepID=UPI0014576F92|nr:tripartite tricarboxylate transporter substrate binding protein [Rhizobium sp. P32RR-XVIII]NLS06082.1 tripartite tricarboxylate transporter substrate binding protein [Rhizobium sp. P32RR-XVIII]
MSPSLSGSATSAEPIRLVIGFSPGSASDTLAQIVAPELKRVTGRPIEIERLPGEDGAIAGRALMGRPADGGHLMIVTLGTHALLPNIRQCGYDPITDFSPIACLARAPLVLGVSQSLATVSLTAFVDYARSARRRIRFGVSAAVGAPRLGAELFREQSGLDIEVVIYAHTRTLYDDLVAGRIEASFNNPMTMLPLCAAGKVTALAATGAVRCPAAPQVPTMRECGFPDFQVENWVGLVAPARLPRETAIALNQAVRDVLADDRIRQSFNEQGMTGPLESADEFGRYMRDEVVRWAPMARVLAGN